jgi:hypothetical protein
MQSQIFSLTYGTTVKAKAWHFANSIGQHTRSIWRNERLKRDMEVGHLFFDHRDNLRHVDLRYAHGSDMKEFFVE